MNGETFSIEFPILVESTDFSKIAAGCTSNSNYYTSGAQRSTCCCGCDQ
jgi:hypothetical protein